MNSGVHDGSVWGATKISPGSKSPIASVPKIMRARPSTTPCDAAAPLKMSPTFARSTLTEPLRGISEIGGIGFALSRKVGTSRSLSANQAVWRSRILGSRVFSPRARASSSLSNAMKICRESSRTPFDARRLPNSIKAIRASFIILIQDDFPLSRQPAKRRAEPMAPRNIASVAASIPSVASSIA